MRKSTLLAALLCLAAMLPAQNLRVLSTQTLGQGNLPHISEDGLTVSCLPSGESWAEQSGDLYVSNENCELILHRNGTTQRLTPDGTDVHYIWSSVSPDRTRILYNTRYGTSICDLQGRKLAYLGHVNAPVWYGNDYVVGHFELSEDIEINSSVILLAKADGSHVQQLTSNDEIALNPSVSAKTGRIVYNNLRGDVRMMQLSKAEKTVNRLPQIVTAERKALKAPIQKARKNSPSDVKIYINPGHGGHGSNDRGMTIYPFKSGDVNGFWESNSNLDKGLFLDSMLHAFGVQTMMSRRTNNDGGGNDADILANWLSNGKITQAEYDYWLVNGDDRSLSAIVREANNYGADFMISIHSNAGNPSNYILQLYSGKDLDDTHIYRSSNPKEAESRAVTTLMGPYLYENKNADWTRQPWIIGDKTFGWNYMGGWGDGYGVLRGLQMGGTISEGSMHDYIPETYRLMNMGYKRAEAFHFFQTFLEYYLDYILPYGAIGGQVRDSSQPMTFPAISYHKGTMDALQPLNRAKVELLQNNVVLATTYTDTLYNGCYYFWDLQPGEYVVRASAEDYYTQEHTVTVTGGHITYQPQLMNFQRPTPPEVVSYIPAPAALTDSIQVSSKIKITFNWDMLVDSTMGAFSISPAVAGKLSFEDGNRTLVFTPSKRLASGTEYTVTVSTKACHPDTHAAQNHLQQPFTLMFRTMGRGNISLLGCYPQDGATDVPLNPSFISLYDQRLNNNNANKNAFVIKDMSGNVMAVNNRSFSFNKAPDPNGYASFELKDALQPATQYKLYIDGSLQDEIGIRLEEQQVITFTTTAALTPDIPVIDVLDTLQFVYEPGASIGMKSAYVMRDANKKYVSTASNKLNYEFLLDEAEAFFAFKNKLLVEAESIDHLGLYIFGDFSGNELYAKFETEGDIHYVKVCDLDYGGWKWQQLDLSPLPESVKFQLTALRIVRKEGILSGSGSIYLNNLSFEAGATGIQDLQGDAQVRKVLENGQVFILKNGERFTLLGTKAQ